jgi:hypothetical protein
MRRKNMKREGIITLPAGKRRRRRNRRQAGREWGE